MSTFPSIDDGDFELYGLGALGPDENARVRRALEDADPADREDMLFRIAGAREAAAALVEAANLDVAPPEHVRAELLESIERRDPAAGAPPQGAVIDARSRFRPAVLVAAAAVVLVLGGTVATIALSSDDDVTDVAGPESPTTQQPVDPGESTDDPAGMVGEIMAAPDANITNASLGSGATAKLMASERLDMAVVEISGMPAAAEGMHYQLWLNGFGPNPIAGGALSVDSTDGRTLMGGIGELSQTSGVAVTQEPNTDPRPPAPTGEILMEMDMA